MSSESNISNIAWAGYHARLHVSHGINFLPLLHVSVAEHYTMYIVSSVNCNMSCSSDNGFSHIVIV